MSGLRTQVQLLKTFWALSLATHDIVFAALARGKVVPRPSFVVAGVVLLKLPQLFRGVCHPDEPTLQDSPFYEACLDDLLETLPV